MSEIKEYFEKISTSPDYTPIYLLGRSSVKKNFKTQNIWDSYCDMAGCYDNFENYDTEFLDCRFYP